MYTQAEIDKAIKLHIKYGSISKTIQKLGYPSYQQMKLWVREYRLTGQVIEKSKTGKHSKFSPDQKKEAIRLALKLDRNIGKTIKQLGYPSRTCLVGWLKDWDKKHPSQAVQPNPPSPRYPTELKQRAVVLMRRKDRSVISIAREFGVPRSTLYAWSREFPEAELPAIPPKQARPTPQPQLMPKQKRRSHDDSASAELDVNQQLENALSLLQEYAKKVEMLNLQTKELDSYIEHLNLQKDGLLKTAEILKKEGGVNPTKLSNREKTLVIDALRNKYKLKGSSKNSKKGELAVMTTPLCV